ncbi:MAG: sugar hydrolase [Lachnospiraceae bacterium]|nr:sugar hydrolase [Lachnospiraceae bacterium]
MENFHMQVDERLVRRAQELRPRLRETPVHPVRLVNIVPRGGDFAAVPASSLEGLEQRPLGRGDRIVFDFGEHRVGYISFTLTSSGSPADAPAHIRLKFGERPLEIAEETADYRGNISSSWLQEEFLHVDVLPTALRLPRRYAFRYMELLVLDTSPKYRVCVGDIACTAVSSGDLSAVPPLTGVPEDLAEIDRISVRTLHECMQDVFEDGPKRDRRLWIGDLRLQAQIDYLTFRNLDLVKRCLYLFAGLTMNEGRVGAGMFTEPEPRVDDTALFDYSLFFVSCLYDYWLETADKEALTDLWPTARRQIELALRELGEDDVVRDRTGWWCFLDWGEGLNKQAGAQGVLIYAIRQALPLAEAAGDAESGSWLQEALTRTLAGAGRLYDAEKGLFVSGAKRQVSWASQVWMVLAEVSTTREERAALLTRTFAAKPEIPMNTPYMVHHLVEALILSGMQDRALQILRDYWGGMVARGADTFWEVYDPEHPAVSPYGSRAVNSYCHAWSSTPSYLIRRYLL